MGGPPRGGERHAGSGGAFLKGGGISEGSGCDCERVGQVYWENREQSPFVAAKEWPNVVPIKSATRYFLKEWRVKCENGGMR